MSWDWEKFALTCFACAGTSLCHFNSLAMHDNKKKTKRKQKEKKDLHRGRKVNFLQASAAVLQKQNPLNSNVNKTPDLKRSHIKL